MSVGIAAYYDRLGVWNRMARLFGYGGGTSTLTVHRPLADPAHGGRPTFTRLHDLLLEHTTPKARPRILDAGCGLGGTMLMFATVIDATCIGLTLSQAQADVANSAAERLGVSDRVRAVVQSYDDPPNASFDMVVAVESLAHSDDPARSVERLAGTIGPGGCFAIVDDMPEADADSSPDLATFKRGWRCPVVWPAAAYADALSRAGLELMIDLDLTAECRLRTRAGIARLMLLNRVVSGIPHRGLRQVMDSHLGGLALERLTGDGLMRYRLLIARRPELQVS
jgi:tocopherol O-methyltransferase